MIQEIQLLPGITLRCFPDHRFKQGCLSLQILRPMCWEEVSLNALIPNVLLRGTQNYPDLQCITCRLDELYGASVGTLSRRIGDAQSIGLFCGFMEDRFALPGDRIFAPMMEFLEELLLHPRTEGEGFCAAFVESEKKNLISTIESERNDKRAWAMNQMLNSMCANDSYGIPRLGDAAHVSAIDPVHALSHYRRILQESRIDLFYVGSEPAQQVAAAIRPIFERIQRNYQPLPPQTAFSPAPEQCLQETMEVSQAKLCMGFVTPITNRTPDFPAMQVCNTIFGSGMTSKLFMHIREQLSLCYSIGSGYYGSKGIVTVWAGIDAEQAELVQQEVLSQLDACRQGRISAEELLSAKEALLSGLRAVHDSPGAIEGYYATAAISGLPYTPAQYMDRIRHVEIEDVIRVAQSIRLHTTYLLKGVEK